MLRSIVITGALTLGACLGSTPAALAQAQVPCAQENGFCRVPYPTQVFYGVAGRMTSRFVSPPGIACSNEVFGDPARGTPKLCVYAESGAAGGDDRRGGRRGYGGDEGRGRGGYGGDDRDRRGYGGGGYGDGGRGEARGSGSECRELRQACLNKDQLGERGEGNCRTYRNLCQ
jgi:hypothetical protein